MLSRKCLFKMQQRMGMGAVAAAAAAAEEKAGSLTFFSYF
jgi:hypothetical protein